MLETVTTNGASILTILVMWSTITWMLTYVYMGRKVADLRARIEVLDWYCYESDVTIDDLNAQLEFIDSQFGDVMDDYTEYYLTDKGWDEL